MAKTNQMAFIMGLTFGIMGAVFLILGIIFLAVYPFQALPDDQQSMMIMGWVFAGMGLGFGITGLVFLLYYRRKRKEIRRLTAEGKCYDAQITKMYQNYGMGYGNRFGYGYGYGYQPSMVVECVYQNDHGENVLVKSQNLWLKRRNLNEKDYRAKVWVDRDDPKKYYVELLENETPGDIRIDKDMR